jgi:hypothetical protein
MATMATLKEIVFDARDPAALARFWAAALDGCAVRPYDDLEIARLARLGHTPATDPNVAVDGPGPTLFFQRRAGLDTGRGRIHLDVHCASRTVEIPRLERLGARVRDVHDTYTVMLDPEGNAFCVQGPP